MEEPKPARSATTTQVTDPPSAAQDPPPPSTLPPNSKKRPLDGGSQIQNSNYFKMRLILKDLRPHFLEVLRTPDFRNCKGAKEIREKMKLMIKLYQQMTAETAKPDNPPKRQFLPNGNGFNQTSQEQLQKVKVAEQSQPERLGVKSSETWSFQTGSVSEKQQPEGGDKAGSYVVGGSAFGWNFITFRSSEPAYYGVTKEAFRSAHPITEGQ